MLGFQNNRFWFAGFLAAGFLCTWASSASATSLSDNLSNATAGTESATPTRYLAQSFTTDNASHQLGFITLLLANASPGTAQIDLYSDDGLEPATLIATLTSPLSYPVSAAEVTFSATGVSLTANTTYWVVLRPITGTFSWSWTADNSGSGAGFDGVWGVTEDGWGGSQGGTPAWYTYDTYPTQMSVHVDELLASVPAISQWGVCWLTLLLLIAATVVVQNRSRETA